MLIILGIILILGGAYFQSKLSVKSNKFLGMIFPLISFISAGMFMILTFSYDSFTFIDIFEFVLMFIIANIPTIILLLIYYISRKQISQNEKIEKMHIQDLN